MAQSHGRQKRAAKQKKRREARKQAKARQPPPAEPRQAEPRQAGPPKRTGPHNKPLHAELAAEIGYDANRVLGSEQWLTLDEREQLARVAAYHERALPLNQQPPSIPRHAGMHVIVENQLASGEPPETGAALQRLFAQGLSRHDALHAIGWVLTEHMGRAMKKQDPVDAKRYAQDLSELTVERWLTQAAGKQ